MKILKSGDEVQIKMVQDIRLILSSKDVTLIQFLTKAYAKVLKNGYLC